MKVIKYKVLLDEENKNILVKESAQLYASEKGEMNTPAQIVHLCNDVLQANRLAEEHLWLLAFNTKNKLLGLFEVSHGTVNGSLITPREIFVRLFLCGAVRFVLVHNHPSGDTTPSAEDIHVTQRIHMAGEMMGIQFLDHNIRYSPGFPLPGTHKAAPANRLWHLQRIPFYIRSLSHYHTRFPHPAYFLIS